MTTLAKRAGVNSTVKNVLEGLDKKQQGINESPIFKTVTQFTNDNPAFAEGGVRHALFFKGVELEDAGAISKFGRKILINEGRWLSLVEQGFFKKISGE
jgi:hypothetical protein